MHPLHPAIAGQSLIPAPLRLGAVGHDHLDLQLAHRPPELRRRLAARQDRRPRVDRTVRSCVEPPLGECVYKGHELTSAGELIRCGHCGYPVTGESVLRKQAGKEDVYYRCSKYTRVEHPRTRLTAAQLDEQIMALFGRIKRHEPVREWFQKMLPRWINDQQQESRSTADDVQRQLTGLRDQQDRLLNLRLLDELEAATFARKHTELRNRIAALTLQLQSAHRCRDERADMAPRVSELSQSLTERWLAA